MRAAASRQGCVPAGSQAVVLAEQSARLGGSLPFFRQLLADAAVDPDVVAGNSTALYTAIKKSAFAAVCRLQVVPPPRRAAHSVGQAAVASSAAAFAAVGEGSVLG